MKKNVVEQLLNKKGIFAKIYYVSLKEFVEKMENKELKIFAGQRDFDESRTKTDGKGFITIAVLYLFNKFLVKNSSIFKNSKSLEDFGIDNCICISNEGYIWDGQHRSNWICKFICNQLEITIAGESLTFKEISEKYPELAEAIMNSNIRIYEIEGCNNKELSELFNAYNSGRKSVSKIDLELAKISENINLFRTIKEFLRRNNDSSPYFNTFSMIYNKKDNGKFSEADVHKFIRTTAYAYGIVETKSMPNEAIFSAFLKECEEKNINNFDDLSRFIRQSAFVHDIIYKDEFLRTLCREKGIHLTKAIVKILCKMSNEFGIKGDFPKYKEDSFRKSFTYNKDILMESIANLETNKICMKDTPKDNGRTEKVFNTINGLFSLK